MKQNKKNKINIVDCCEFSEVRNGEPDYVGLRIERDEKNLKKFKIIFPVDYYTPEELQIIKHPTSEDKLKEDIKNLLKAIYRVNISDVYGNNSSIKNSCPIDAYLWIIRNYQENGYYIERETTYTKEEKGKIDWKKTIKNNKFLLDDNFNIFYTELITKKSRNNLNNIITLIHKYCVYEAVSTFYFLAKNSINVKNIEKPNLNMKKEGMLQILKKEYSKTFIDSKKQLIDKMIKMLEWLNDKKTNYDMFSISHNKFHVIFEELIDERFGNISNLQDYYPFANWHIKEYTNKSSYLREDSILEVGNKIYILDAKYYKYAYYNDDEDTSRLPGTSSITKQILYGKYLDEKFKHSKEIYNIFLIPYNKGTEKEYIEYVGYADAEWLNKNELSTYGKIYTFKVDLKTLVNSRGKDEKGLLTIINDVI